MKDFWPIHNHGELAVVYCFVFLYMSAAGGGSFSIDNCRQRRRAEQTGQAPAQK
jgi:putative oxidoreductase